MFQKTLFFALLLVLAPFSLLAESPHFDKKSNTYVVQKGDCLWSISQDVWDDGLKWSFIYAANEKKIQDPGMIYPGEKFTIPPTITKELRQKAIQLVYQQRESAPATKPTSDSTAKPATKRSADSASGTAETSPPAEETAQKSEEPASSSGGSTGLFLLIAAALALAGGIYLWKRNRFSSSEEPQKPQSLSSFPRETTPFQPKPTSPSPSNGSASSQSPAPTQPRSFEATITSVSMPSTRPSPNPSVTTPASTEAPKPSEPSTQVPSQLSQPTTQPSAASSQPVSSPSSEDKPQDPANPPSSSPQNN
jgi:hypothetical protein